MMIAKNTKARFLVVLFLGTTLGGHGQSYAGFQAAESASSNNSSAPVVVSNVQMDGSPLPPATKTAGLEVFNDRYVPDSVRKKYNLDDSWFGKDVPPQQQLEQPTQITPNILNTNDGGMTAMPVLPPVDAPMNDTKMMAAQPVAKQDPKQVVESWRGRKGENIRDVLQRWSVRSGANLMWASPDAPTLQKEFTYVGKFQDAVNALIKTEGGDKIHSQYRSEGLNPVMMAPASTVTTNTPPALKDAPPPAPVAKTPAMIAPIAKIFQQEEKKEVKPETRWFALSGAPLAEVIKVWSEDAGVRLIWQSEKNFAVKESISQIGHYEDAVFKALNQYNAEEIRPVGEMYKDPQSGQLILVVRTEVN